MNDQDEDFSVPVGRVGEAFIEWCEANGISGHDYQREAYAAFVAGWLASEEYM